MLHEGKTPRMAKIRIFRFRILWFRILWFEILRFEILRFKILCCEILWFEILWIRILPLEILWFEILRFEILWFQYYKVNLTQSFIGYESSNNITLATKRALPCNIACLLIFWFSHQIWIAGATTLQFSWPPSGFN